MKNEKGLLIFNRIFVTSCIPNMIDVQHARCSEDGCTKYPTYFFPDQKKKSYCYLHKLPGMISTRQKKVEELCDITGCEEKSIITQNNIRYCVYHNIFKKKPTETKCDVKDCNKKYTIVQNGVKFCADHNNIQLKKKECKYCELKDDSDYICQECYSNKNKKEWMTVRQIRMRINTQFQYNSSSMLNGCSKKKPDIYFELDTHCVIVEIDENQHNGYLTRSIYRVFFWNNH
jgi:hypothetical protein